MKQRVNLTYKGCEKGEKTWREEKQEVRERRRYELIMLNAGKI